MESKELGRLQPVSGKLEKSSDAGGFKWLECSCCGDDGAFPDERGRFHDGQTLTCGCKGWVCVEEDGDVWINAYDCDCGS